MDNAARLWKDSVTPLARRAGRPRLTRLELNDSEPVQLTVNLGIKRGIEQA